MNKSHRFSTVARVLGVTVAIVAVSSCTPTDTGGTATTTTSPSVPPVGIRTTQDRPDDSALSQVKAIYVVASDGVDRQFDLLGQIERSVDGINSWFLSEGGAALRMDTYGGELDVAFMQLTLTEQQVYAAGTLQTLTSALGNRGFSDAKKTYVMFYDGSEPGACGSAWQPGNEAGIYLQTPNCGDLGAFGAPLSWIDFTWLHEVFHSAGASADCAPNMGSPGHVNDHPADLMYAGPLVRPLPRVLDFGRDDYWDHSNVGCLDMADSALIAPLPDAAPSVGAESQRRSQRGPEVVSAAPSK